MIAAFEIDVGLLADAVVELAGTRDASAVRNDGIVGA
jgi:hypothetical protein